MASSPRYSEENIERDSTRRSFKEKSKRFVKRNKTILMVVSIIATILFVAILFYFVFFHESKMSRFANDFCVCAESSSSDFYNYTKDDFGYKSDMSECFGKDFSAYGNSYDKSTKHLLLEDFKKAVTEKCPEKLEKVFQYD